MKRSRKQLHMREPRLVKQGIVKPRFRRWNSGDTDGADMLEKLGREHWLRRSKWPTQIVKKFDLVDSASACKSNTYLSL